MKAYLYAIIVILFCSSCIRRDAKNDADKFKYGKFTFSLKRLSWNESLALVALKTVNNENDELQIVKTNGDVISLSYDKHIELDDRYMGSNEPFIVRYCYRDSTNQKICAELKSFASPKMLFAQLEHSPMDLSKLNDFRYEVKPLVRRPVWGAHGEWETLNDFATDKIKLVLTFQQRNHPENKLKVEMVDLTGQLDITSLPEFEQFKMKITDSNSPIDLHYDLFLNALHFNSTNSHEKELVAVNKNIMAAASSSNTASTVTLSSNSNQLHKPSAPASSSALTTYFDESVDLLKKRFAKVKLPIKDLKLIVSSVTSTKNSGGKYVATFIATWKEDNYKLTSDIVYEVRGNLIVGNLTGDDRVELNFFNDNYEKNQNLFHSISL